ncbi:MAG: NAD-dependent epimerase/dehydratase family protein [Candidatus Omnitrophica bacterium]|nr:NAD-dependent epimerase/dehydratase family protein [Candidatus Omnitrophota bacterium]
MKKRILITGGTGLVGSSLTKRIKEVGLPIISVGHKGSVLKNKDDSLGYDFCKFKDCLDATRNIEAAVFCAAISYGVKKNKELPTAAILPNLEIFTGLFEACARNKVRRIIMLSSSTIYQPAGYPIKEDDLDLNQSPYQEYFGIGWTYRYLEQLACLYSITYGIQVLILRPTNIYGPFDKFDEERAHVIPSLIRRALNKQEPFEVWGKPDVIRDFVFVGDVVDDILSIIKDEVDLHSLPVNICSGRPISIKEAAEIILETCGHKTKVNFNSQKPTAIPYRALDSSRYLKTFGSRKRTAFRDGIKKTVEWFKKNGE